MLGDPSGGIAMSPAKGKKGSLESRLDQIGATRLAVRSLLWLALSGPL